MLLPCSDIVETVGVDAPLEPLLPAVLDLGPPKQCNQELCGKMPKCVTTFLPRAGESLMEYVISPDPQDITYVADSDTAANNRVGTHRPCCPQPLRFYTDMIWCCIQSLCIHSSTAIGQLPSVRCAEAGPGRGQVEDWHQQLYFCDVGAVDYMLAKGFNYLDRKIILQGNNHAGPLKLAFETQTENYLLVCSAPGNAHICHSAEWKVDGEKVKCLDEDGARAASK
jgi:hypothetical protein